MAELVDALDLGSSAERRVGSSPSIRTKKPEKAGFFDICKTVVHIIGLLAWNTN